MFIWQSIYVQSPSPGACLCNTEYCLIIINTELHLQFHTVYSTTAKNISPFFSQDRQIFCRLAVCGYPKWLGLSRLCWLETEQGSQVTTCESIKKMLEDVTCHFGAFFFLDWPQSVLLSCPLSGFVQWRIVEESLVSTTLPFFDSCRPTSTFQGSRVVRNAT